MATSLNRLDLNLLRVFDAVMEERSVLRAGQRICLSQSAVSHALARLRDVLGDELFIRTPTGMQPTVRALAMTPLIREAWVSLEAAIGPPKFEPGHSTKRFTIAASDFATLVMMPHLLNLLRSEAPFVDFVVRPDSRLDLIEQLDLGQIDAAIGTFSDVSGRFRSCSLFQYDDVLIAGSTPRLAKLSLEKLSELSIAVVSSLGEHEAMANGFVSERGLARRSEMYDRAALEHAYSGWKKRPRLAVSLPHFLALPSLLDLSDLVAIVPRPLAKLLARMPSLSIHELPYKSSHVDVGVLWHERNATDAAQEWLRKMLRRAADSLRSASAECESAAPARTSVRSFSVVNSNGEEDEASGRAPKSRINVRERSARRCAVGLS
jgi:DNA-binding transcriptional LysR family regulator